MIPINISLSPLGVEKFPGIVFQETPPFPERLFGVIGARLWPSFLVEVNFDVGTFPLSSAPFFQRDPWLESRVRNGVFFFS